jgi:gas vesicle protein
VRGRVADAAAPVMESAGEMLDQAAERAQQIRGSVMQTAASAQSHAGEMAGEASQRAGGLVHDLKSGAAQTAGTVTDRLADGMAAAKDGFERARDSARDTVGAAKDAAAAAPEKARRLVGDNAALIGGIGVAIGAIVAAALPKTEVEVRAMSGARDSAKQVAGKAAQSGIEAARQTARSAADAAEKRIADADLGAHASRMTRNVADTLKEAAEDVVTAAFDPPRHPTS